MSHFRAQQALLTVAQMYETDRRAMADGIAGSELMERAGAAVADAILARWSTRATVVLCGPGNNGGDGFVVARRLAECGWPVRLALHGKRSALSGDAGAAAALWQGAVERLDPAVLEGAELVVDALFGAGLSRDVEGVAATTLAAIDVPCVAVDVPSGLDGDTGAVRGKAHIADLTVTFARAKPGHILLPGRSLCGELVVADIGIADSHIEALRPDHFRNGPRSWPRDFPWRTAADHKYARGHLVVAGGGVASTGAARLAARAGLRVGAGLVTVASPPAALMVYAGQQTSVMVRPDPDVESFVRLIAEPRVTAVVLGPGQGLGAATRERVLAALATGKPTVLDADALSVFAADPAALFHAIRGSCILTPHEGEFRRLFDVAGSRAERARQAARTSGAVVVLKGADSIVALSDGTIVINDNAPPELATAGSGDVLAGLAGGLLAQGVEAPVAAAMAVWLHGACGAQYGPGLIAEDLPEVLPAVLRRLKDPS